MPWSLKNPKTYRSIDAMEHDESGFISGSAVKWYTCHETSRKIFILLTDEPVSRSKVSGKVNGMVIPCTCQIIDDTKSYFIDMTNYPWITENIWSKPTIKHYVLNDVTDEEVVDYIQKEVDDETDDPGKLLGTSDFDEYKDIMEATIKEFFYALGIVDFTDHAMYHELTNHVYNEPYNRGNEILLISMIDRFIRDTDKTSHKNSIDEHKNYIVDLYCEKPDEKTKAIEEKIYELCRRIINETSAIDAEALNLINYIADEDNTYSKDGLRNKINELCKQYVPGGTIDADIGAIIETLIALCEQKPAPLKAVNPIDMIRRTITDQLHAICSVSDLETIETLTKAIQQSLDERHYNEGKFEDLIRQHIPDIQQPEALPWIYQTYKALYDQYVEDWERKETIAASEQEFEEAAKIRDHIAKLKANAEKQA